MGKRLTDQQWMELIQECRVSGLTDADWLRQYHPEIHRTTFYRAIRRLREKACEIPQAVHSDYPERQDIVEIDFSMPEIAANEPASLPADTRPVYKHEQAVIRLEYHGIELTITNTASGAVISNTIAALAMLC